MKQPVRVIVIAAVLSLIVHFMNHWTDNAVYDFVDKNPLMKSFMFFLTLGGFIGIFFPFTLQKSIDEMDVRSIYEKKQKEDEQNRRIEQEATF